MNIREDFEARTLAFLRPRLGPDFSGNAIDWDANFIEAGYLDSLGIYELISYLEDELNIELPIESLLSDGVTSLRAIHNLIYAAR